MELPYLSGKTIKTISIIESDSSIDEVRLTHSDGSILIITGEYIKVRFEPVIARTQATATTVSPRSDWPGEQ